MAIIDLWDDNTFTTNLSGRSPLVSFSNFVVSIQEEVFWKLSQQIPDKGFLSRFMVSFAPNLGLDEAGLADWIIKNESKTQKAARAIKKLIKGFRTYLAQLDGDVFTLSETAQKLHNRLWDVCAP